MLLEIDVTGAANDREATAIARRVATSPLVKTAAFGRDPNWGRVLAAAGSATWNGGFAQLDPERVSLAFNGTTVYADGAPLDSDPDLSGGACRISLELGLGERARRLPGVRPHLRLRAHQRGVHDVSRLILQVRRSERRPRRARARAILASAGSRRSASSTAPGRRSPTRWSGAASTVRFVDGRRYTTAEALDIVRESLADVNASTLRGSRAARDRSHGRRDRSRSTTGPEARPRR